MDPDFDDFEQIAFGELGLTPAEFYDMTPRQFDNMLKGYKRKEEREERLKWEINRTLMFSIASPYIGQKDKGKTVFDLYPLPWDPQPEKKVIIKKRTAKEREALFEKMDQLSNKNNGK